MQTDSVTLDSFMDAILKASYGDSAQRVANKKIVSRATADAVKREFNKRRASHPRQEVHMIVIGI